MQPVSRGTVLNELSKPGSRLTPWKQIKFCLSDKWFCYVSADFELWINLRNGTFSLPVSFKCKKKPFLFFLFIFYFYFYNFQLHTLTSFARA